MAKSDSGEHNKLKLGKDYTINEKNEYVFTQSFLRRRGFCCLSGCLNCPYDVDEYEGSKVKDADVPVELKLEEAQKNEKIKKDQVISDEELEDLEKYK